MTRIDWPFLIGMAVVGALLGLLLCAVIPHRPIRRSRSDSEPQ